MLTDGFVRFKDLYNKGTNDPVQWDISQLKSEQQVLQPVHEGYLSDKELFRDASRHATDNNSLGYIFDDRKTIKGGIDILDYKSRVEYGCKLLGYNAFQGCAP